MTARTQFVAFLLILSIGSSAFADDGSAKINAPAEEPNRQSVSTDDINGWIANLNSSEFKARNEALQKLVQAGQAAVDPVAAAANTGNLEVAIRCLEGLKRLFHSKDAAVKAAAKSALEKLKASDKASVAQRAVAIIAPPPPAVLKRPGGIFGGGLRLQVRANFGRNVKIQIQRNNNITTRKVDVNENGRKVHIEETTGKGIIVKVTEGPAGKQKTTEYKAKDAAELKKKHPDGFKIYEKYGQQKNAPKIVINGVANGVPFKAAPFVLPGANTSEGKRVEAARNKLQAISKRLSDPKNQNLDKHKQLQDELRKAAKELHEATRKFAESRLKPKK